MTNRLCITSNQIDLKPLIEWCQKNQVELLAQPFIEFQKLPFSWDGTEDILFFSSPRSVNYFVPEVMHLLENKHFACVGESTALALKKFGIQSDFTGIKSGKPEEIALQFRDFVGSRSVLFPCSTISLKTIANALPQKQVHILEVYNTIFLDISIPPCTKYVFTSPSNVQSFLQNNDLPESAEVIAWGKSTEQSLIDSGCHVTHVLADSSVNELIAYLNN